MKQWLSFITWLGMFLGGCQSPSEHSEGSARCSIKEWVEHPGLHVLATTGQVADLVARVLGDRGSVLTLIGGDLDPHSYQLVKGDDEKLAMADLVFASGLGLEHGPSLQSFLNHSPKAIRLGDGLMKCCKDRLLSVDGQVDPHVWLDPSLWSQSVSMIEERFIRADPSGKEGYQLRSCQLMEELQKLNEWILEQIHSIPEERRYLVTSHDAFSYFVRQYFASLEEQADGSWKKRLCAPEGLAPEGQLGISDIERVLQFCEKYQIQVLFPEDNVNQSPLRKVVDTAQHRGLNVHLSSQPLFGDTMGEELTCGVGHAYAHMMRHNAQVLLSELKEKSP